MLQSAGVPSHIVGRGLDLNRDTDLHHLDIQKKFTDCSSREAEIEGPDAYSKNRTQLPVSRRGPAHREHTKDNSRDRLTYICRGAEIGHLTELCVLAYSTRKTVGSNILDLKGAAELVTGAGQGAGARSRCASRITTQAWWSSTLFDGAPPRQCGRQSKAWRQALPVQCDVTDFASVTAMFEKAKAKFAASTSSQQSGNAGADASRVRNANRFGAGAEDWDGLHGPPIFTASSLRARAVPRNESRKSTASWVPVISDAGLVGEPQLEILLCGKGRRGGLHSRGKKSRNSSAHSITSIASRSQPHGVRAKIIAPQDAG